jgi:hypothetical protein
MATRHELQRRIEEVARELSEELGEVDASEGDCWLDAIESRATQIGDALSAALLAQQSGRRPAGVEEATCPQCGKTGRYVGDRQRELISRRGPVTISEPEYFCPCCRKDFFPSDHGDRR